MKFAHKIDRKHDIRTAAETTEPGYLARRFAAIRKRQAAAAKKPTGVVRKLSKVAA